MAPFRVTQETELERLKNSLLQARLRENPWEPDLNSQLRRAANEAASLAWVTPFPLLVFPVLFEEKAHGAAGRLARQRQIRARSRELLVV